MTRTPTPEEEGSMSHRTICIDFDKFEETYDPILNPSTGGFEAFENGIEVRQAALENRLWTALHDDDAPVGHTMYLLNGRHLVNRLHYIITRIPWTGPYAIQVSQVNDD